MNDLTVTSPHGTGSRWNLKGLEELATSACMSFKSVKSRFPVLMKGKVTDDVTVKFHFTLDTTDHRETSESLWRVFNCNLRDMTVIQYQPKSRRLTGLDSNELDSTTQHSPEDSGDRLGQGPNLNSWKLWEENLSLLAEVWVYIWVWAALPFMGRATSRSSPWAAWMRSSWGATLGRSCDIENPLPTWSLWLELKPRQDGGGNQLRLWM